MSIPGFRSPAAHQTGANRPSPSIGAYAQNAGKPRVGGPLALLLLGLALLLPACKHTPPEQALRDTIAKMQSAGETGDVDALFKPIAEDFSGSEGMDRTAFRRYVTLMRMSHKDVGVAIGPIEVKLLGDRATANFTATITGGPGSFRPGPDLRHPDRLAPRRLHLQSVGVTLGPVEVKLFGDRATAKFTAAITGGPGFLPNQAQVYEIETGWRLEGADWKLISAHWQEKL
jgi:hypothetical protein